MLPAIAIAMTCIPLRAHEVVVEQIAKVIVAPHPNQLDVRVEIPATLLNDAGLARQDDGRIDPKISGTVLQTIAVDVARNLDMRRDGVALPVTRATAELGADGRSVDVNVIYALAGPAAGLSARLNAFQGTALRPPRTDAIYLASPNRPQHTTLTGPPARVSFDPDSAEAFRQAAGRAFDQILSGAGDHLLFLICLLLPMRPVRESVRLVGAVLAAQAAGIVASPILLLAMGVPLLAVQTVASSAVVAGALCAIIGTSWSTLTAISCVFGLLSGVEFGAAFESIRPFAGSHGWLALLTFSLVALGVESWLAAVMVATRRWLDHLTASAWILCVVTAAIVAHVAVHRVLDRGSALEQAGAIAGGHVLMLLALAWALAMVAVALARLARERRDLSHRRMAGPAS